VKAVAYCALAALTFVAPSHASLIPYLNGTPTQNGSDFLFNYIVNLEPDASIGSGTFITFYDITGFVGATPPANWSVTTANVGMTPSNINGAAIDNPNVINVTFEYNGPTLATDGSPTKMPGFEIFSTDSGTTTGTYSFQDSMDVGQETGKPLQGVGPIAVPAGAPGGTGTGSGSAVPEPSTFLMLGSGLSAVFLIGRRRRRT